MSPQPISVDLFTQIQERAAFKPLSELEKRAFRSQAERLKNTDPAHAFAAMGYLACLERNIPLMRECHTKALTASGNDPIEIHNFSLSLALCDLVTEAIERAHDAVSRQPASSHFTGTYLFLLLQAKRVDELISALENWKKATGQSHPIEDELDALGVIDNYARIIAAEKEGIPLDEIEAYKEMLLDTEEELTAMCTMASHAALSRSWKGEDQKIT